MISRYLKGVLPVLLMLSVHAAAQTVTEAVVPPGNENADRKVRVLLVPVVETILASEIAGRIEAIRVDLGGRFRKGQTLVLFDCAVYEGHLKVARAVAAEARKTLEVNRRLETLKSISDLEVAVAAARMDRADAEQSLREIQVKKCTLKAPFSGRLVKRIANPFEYVTPGKPLLEIIDDVNLRLHFFIPSRWLQWIRPDHRFEVRLDETGKTYFAQVTALGARVDPTSQTLDVRAVIDGKHKELLAGMSGTAFFRFDR